MKALDSYRTALKQHAKKEEITPVVQKHPSHQQTPPGEGQDGACESYICHFFPFSVSMTEPTSQIDQAGCIPCIAEP